jgi:phosphoribosylformylglycinamidine synthase
MGRITIKNTDHKFIPVLKYTDGCYPMNPNGSFENIAGVVNLDGRILGLMPHFERSFINYQCAYIPPEYSKIQKSPWFIIGQNIAKFLDQV